MPQLGERKTRRDGLAFAEWDGSQWIEKPMSAVSKAPAAGGGSARHGLTPQENKTLADLGTAARNIRSARENAFEFVKRNANTGTGGIMAIPGASEVIGAFDPDVATMQGLSNDMLPGMHTTPGPMTDADAKMYRSAVPNPNLPGPANLALAKNISRKEQEHAARAAFFQSYAKRAGTLNGADVAFNRFWSDYSRRKDPPPQKGAGGADNDPLGIRGN